MSRNVAQLGESVYHYPDEDGSRTNHSLASSYKADNTNPKEDEQKPQKVIRQETSANMR